MQLRARPLPRSCEIVGTGDAAARIPGELRVAWRMQASRSRDCGDWTRRMRTNPTVAALARHCMPPRTCATPRGNRPICSIRNPARNTHPRRAVSAAMVADPAPSQPAAKAVVAGQEHPGLARSAAPSPRGNYCRSPSGGAKGARLMPRGAGTASCESPLRRGDSADATTVHAGHRTMVLISVEYALTFDAL